jgi:hypothetical protein
MPSDIMQIMDYIRNELDSLKPSLLPDDDIQRQQLQKQLKILLGRLLPCQ